MFKVWAIIAVSQCVTLHPSIEVIMTLSRNSRNSCLSSKVNLQPLFFISIKRAPCPCKVKSCIFGSSVFIFLGRGRYGPIEYLAFCQSQRSFAIRYLRSWKSYGGNKLKKKKVAIIKEWTNYRKAHLSGRKLFIKKKPMKSRGLHHFPRNLSTQLYYIRDKMIFKPEENENAAFSFAYGQNKNILKRSFLANLFEYISYW